MSKPFCPTCKEEFDKDIRYCPNDGTAIISPQAESLQDQIFDSRYKIADKIGEGGMGSVYKAVQLSTGKYVAIKVVSSRHTQNEETIRRFQREVKLQTKLSHPNLVSILDFSKTSEGEYYFAMEFVEGKSLTKFIKERGQLSMEEFMEIASQLCSGLEYAHRQGVIHRDLKGDNIIVTDIGHQLVVKILDFGLAKAVAEGDQQITSNITQMGSALGTPAYMAPEQAMGEVNKLGPHTDIYTLGVLFYQMLTGQLPFKASTPWGLMQKHIAETPPMVRDFNRSIPNAVDKIVMKCLEKDPDARYSSAVALKRDLEKTTFAIQKEGQLSLADSDETTMNIKAVRSRRKLWISAIAILAACSAGLIWAVMQNPELYLWGSDLAHSLGEQIGALTNPQPEPPAEPAPSAQPAPGEPSQQPPASPGTEPEPESEPAAAEPSSPAEGPPPPPPPPSPPVIDESVKTAFAGFIAEANKAMEANELTHAGELLAKAEELIPGEPSLEAAKKTLTDKVEEIAKTISDDIGYIEAIDRKWGFIKISRIKGVKVDLDEKLYTIGKDGKVKQMVVKKIYPTKISAVPREKISQFEERKKVTRKPPEP